MDKKVRHTPGPWRFSLQQLSDGRTIPDYFEIKSGVGYWTPEDNSVGFSLTGYMSEGNARLIASAPLLLEALEEMMAVYPAGGRGDAEDRNRAVEKAIAALKLAKDGES